jgi:hypothetical protein
MSRSSEDADFGSSESFGTSDPSRSGDEEFMVGAALARWMIPEEVRHGARLFNEGKYFEAHEAWEDHWGKGGPEERAATLGLIKAAVALHHLEAGNAAGFAWQGGEAVKHLRAQASVWPELGLAALAEELESLLAQVRFHGAPKPPFSPVRLPDV